MEEYQKKENIRQLSIMLSNGHNKDSIEKSGNLKGITPSDLSLDLIEGLRKIGIFLGSDIESELTMTSLGKEFYNIFRSGKGYGATIVKSWVRDHECDSICWKTNSKGYLIGIPIKSGKNLVKIPNIKN
jgi:hypothetical protein